MTVLLLLFVVGCSTVGVSDDATAKPTTSACGKDPLKSNGKRWVCTFADDFSGTAMDPKKWLVQETATSGLRSGSNGCLVDQPENVRISGGKLLLTATKSDPSLCTDPVSGDFTTEFNSGTVSTNGRFSQTRGRFEIRARFPATAIPGLQSALWLWPDDSTKYGAWPLSGEIDIAETYTRHPKIVIPYLHYLSAQAESRNTAFCRLPNAADYHVYRLTWTTTTLRISIDGRTCMNHVITPASPLAGGQPFDHPFFVALTQAVGVGDNLPTDATPFPATTAIDYVRVWK